MDQRGSLCANTWAGSPSLTSPGNGSQTNLSSDPSTLPDFGLQQNQQKWVDLPISDYVVRVEELPFKEYNQPSQTQPSLLSCISNNEMDITDQENHPLMDSSQTIKLQNWDLDVMLNSLSFLEEKIHQLQDIVQLLVVQKDQSFEQPSELVTQEQQLITADLTSVIVQLISTAGNLLPSVRNTLTSTCPIDIGRLGPLSGISVPSSASGPVRSCIQPQNDSAIKLSDQSLQSDDPRNCAMEQNKNMEEHESKEEEDADDGENLPPGSYEILQLEKEEILAPHTHFCPICGKGFKRDANLRMHMRGHGDEYKTAAALAKPQIKESLSQPKLIRRYSCPYVGCKRNKDHKKFQPLKTILCVKNHYKRTHCDKKYTCSKCHTKKFSVMADLKTHEKHCGKDKWLCSCGTTFSRKDKLFGHIALFQGHTPAISSFGSNPSSGNQVQNAMDNAKGSNEEYPSNYFSSMNYERNYDDGFNEYPQPTCEGSKSEGLSFLMAGSFES